MVIFAEITENW